MKLLITLFHLTLSLCLISCNHTAKKRQLDALSFIDDFLKNGTTVEETKKYFGDPNKISKIKGVSETLYDYRNKEYPTLRWRFGVNDSRQIEWFNYRPGANPLLNRIEVLPTTFKKYNCQKKRKPDTRVPHVIREYTFFECAEGKMRAYYNTHGEISLIAVNR